MTVREALGGPWAAHWLVIVAFLPPSTVLVLLRESATPFPEWWWPLASAGAQHLVTAAVILIGVRVARLFHEILPLPTVLAIWALGAALRGVVAGSIAEQVAGVDSQMLGRSAVWVVVSLAGVPLVVYAVAQFERRRVLLGAIDVTAYELQRERPRADASSAEVQRQLRVAVAESLTPALTDLQKTLDASRGRFDRSAIAELSLRVSKLHDEAADLLDSARETPPSPPRPVASLRRALDVPPRRPWVTALLVGATTSALLVIDTAIVFGGPAAIEVALAVAAAALAIGGLPAIVARAHPRGLLDAGHRTTGIAALLGILVATAVVLGSGLDPILEHGIAIAPALALCLAIASVSAAAALVLAEANHEAEHQRDELQRELRILTERSSAIMAHERRRLSDLMHGPVQGRIAACIMALNFHTTGGAGPEAGRDLADAMLAHLGAVSRDLAKIIGAAPGS